MRTLNVRLLFSLIAAFGLSIIPLPDILMAFRPPWLLLLILYIQFFLPQYFIVTLLVFLGVCLDVLLSTVIGEHAFALILTTWIASGKVRRFHFLAMIQQLGFIALLCFVYQSILFLTDAFLGYNYQLCMVVGPVLGSLFLWPTIHRLLCHMTVSAREI
jgi:rod shape-determining protein MreD